ncbi:MAG: hypothetical protein U1F66_11720 [bacterium]
MKIQAKDYNNSAKQKFFLGAKSQARVGGFERILQNTLGQSVLIAQASRSKQTNTSSQWIRA